LLFTPRVYPVIWLRPMSVPDPNILDKIRKLMRVDEARGATSDEVAQALALAQKLALKHAVDLDELDVQEITGAGEPFVTEDHRPVRSDGKLAQRQLPACHKYIAFILNSFFQVDVLTFTAWEKYESHYGVKKEGRVRRMQIHGRKTHVSVAIYVYGYLYHEFMTRWREHLRANPGTRMSDRNGFFLGLYNGLSEKLLKEKGRAEKEVQKEIVSATSTALVLVREEERREASLKEAHPRLKYVKVDTGDVNDWGTYREGQAQGKKIEIKTALR
jgi:Protein of unknown function (DUF2786)